MSEHVFEVDFYPGNFYEHVFGVLSYFFHHGWNFFFLSHSFVETIPSPFHQYY